MLSVLKYIAIIMLAWVALGMVNMLHDPLIHTFVEDGIVDGIPYGPVAEIISISVIFLAGVVAAFVVSALSGKGRNVMMVILLALFLIIDLQATLRYLANTSLLYRLTMVALVPVQIWWGFLCGAYVQGKFEKAK